MQKLPTNQNSNPKKQIMTSSINQKSKLMCLVTVAHSTSPSVLVAVVEICMFVSV